MANSTKFISAIFLVFAMGNQVPAETVLSFNQNIRPIISEYCYACHGPDENNREADLRLDDFDAAVDFGAIVPGEPQESLVIERIQSDDPELVMPPPHTSKSLRPEEKQLLVEWIRQGAEYERHWSFEPVPKTVSVPTTDAPWPRNPIDHFVAKKLPAVSLLPSSEADRAAWLRRVTFDLTGLPPSLEELDTFLSDSTSDAYDRVVDRLLHSPAYGERMANMWLDVARYADTFGYQNDIEMKVSPWRDWVIRAFNRNLPYDQFIIEQIAGDLLPNATAEQHLATTFNRLHRQTNEGGSIPEEFRLTGIADRTTTAGTAFLGLTLECCRCHDHKFDPIKQKEFYQLSAYFSDIDEFGLYSHFTFSAPTPAMLLYEGDQQQRHQAAVSAVVEARRQLDEAMERARQQWSEREDELPASVVAPTPVFALELDGDASGVVGKSTTCNGDDAIECTDAPLFGRTSPFSYAIWVHPANRQPRMVVLHQSRAAEDSGFRGIQLTIDDGHPEFSMTHFWPGNAVRIRATNPIDSNSWTHLTVTHDGSGQAVGLRLYADGRQCEVDIVRDGLTRDVRHRTEWGDLDVESAKLALGARFRDVGFRDGKLDDLRVFDRQITGAEVLSIWQCGSGDSSPTINRELAVEHQLLTTDVSIRDARKRLEQARDAENELMTQVREIMTMRHSDDAPPTHVLSRGSYAEKGERVEPATPSFTAGLSAEGEGRLALARWITDPRNPLTARVMANRMWHLFFGRGIVASLEDFGSQGTPPTHPEMLDYLARSFMDNGWDLHDLCRQIVLSAAYRQSSTPNDPRAYEADPDNIWLARGPKHRLSAEQLRDAVLAASGLLVRKIGGPSVMPYQPPGLWQESGTGKRYRQSTGDGLYRRSLYTFWKRTAPPPSMLTFDAPSRESCTARRELTTTPLQALALLNDPQYVEASRVLAQTLLDRHKVVTDKRWIELFRRLICRQPSAEERRLVERLYGDQLNYFREDTKRTRQFLEVGTRAIGDEVDLADLAATTVVVQAIFAYDETIMLR